MPLPAGIDTCTVTMSVPLDALGRLATSVVGTVRPDRYLVWQATGEPILPIGAKLPEPSGGLVTMTLPTTNQSGILDSEGNAVADWSYRIEYTVRFANRQKTTLTKPFQIDQALTSLDLDSVPFGNVVTPPVTAPAAVVQSLAGRTGVVSAEQLAADLKPSLGGVLAIARDESDAEWAITVSSFATAIIGMSVTVPPVDRPIKLSYHAYGKITVTGVGVFGYTIVETTSAAAVDIGGNTTSLLDNAGTFEGIRAFHGSVTVAPLAVPTWRTFRLYAGIFRASGTGTAVTLKSGATKSRSAYLMAELI